MKIAVTADLHLTSKEARPERFRALENILQQMIFDKIGNLVIAGDLFDEESRNYSEFEALCGSSKYRHIHFHIIPGNHDIRLSVKSFASENITVYSVPELKQLDLISLPMLFLPYRKDQTMGEGIAASDSQLKRGEWILIGHGDWAENLREPNPFEPGVYMPLTRMDVETARPAQAVIGHVHKSFDRDVVHVPGSPCGLDITETGRRRFLILDTESGAVQPKAVETDVLYFDESLIVIPVQNEEEYVRERIESMFKRWNLSDAEKGAVRLRLTVSGYTADKQRIARILKDLCKGIKFYQVEASSTEIQDPQGLALKGLDPKGPDPQGLDITGLSISDDPERADIARRVGEKLSAMPWAPDWPVKKDAFLHALRTIYED